MFQPLQQQPRKISFGTLAFLGILAGLSLFSLWYFKIEPVYTLVTPIVEGARGIGQTFIPAVTDYITKNPLAVLTAAITIGGVVGGKLLQSHYESQKAQLQQQAQQIATDNMSLSQAYAKLEQEKVSLQQQLQNTQTSDSSNLLGEAQAIISQKTEETKRLQAQVQALQDMLMLKDTKVIEKTVVK